MSTFGVGEEQDLAAAAHELQGLVDRGVGRDGSYCRVEGREPRAERWIDFALDSRRSTLDQSRPLRAEFSGEAQARGEQIGGEDADAAQLQKPREHEANRPLPGHLSMVSPRNRLRRLTAFKPCRPANGLAYRNRLRHLPHPLALGNRANFILFVGLSS